MGNIIWALKEMKPGGLKVLFGHIKNIWQLSKLLCGFDIFLILKYCVCTICRKNTTCFD